MYCRLIDGSLVTLSKAKYARTDPQILSTSHVPLTDLNGAIPLGLDWQTWTINGVIADPQSIRWHDIIWLSLDNVSWRACRVQATAFPTNNYQQSTYELTVLVSPTLEGAVVRYPATGYKFGNQSITGISQAGNVSAYPTIHFLAPLFYAPLSNTLIDFTGQSVTFARWLAKAHNGITYPINTPIFDSGLYLASDTAQDVATWTPPASTLRTIAMQIKQTRTDWSGYPPPSWSIGGGGVNLLTANQSNAETNTTGMYAHNGTLTRTTTAGEFYSGSAGFKLVSASNGNMDLCTAMASPAVTVGKMYQFSAYVKSAAAKNIVVEIVFYNSGGTALTLADSVPVAASTTFTRLGVAAIAPAGATQVVGFVFMVSSATGEILFADNLMINAFQPPLYVWTSAHNNLYADLANNRLGWDDGASTVYLALPAAYLAGTVMDVVLLEDTSHAVTLAVHPAGGSWTSATGTLAALTWPPLSLGLLEGSIANLVMYSYVLTSTEYQTLAYSSLSLLYNTLYVGNRYAGEVVKGSDGRLLNAAGADISALLGGVDIPIGSAAVTIAQSQGLSARWYVELHRTDV